MRRFAFAFVAAVLIVAGAADAQSAAPSADDARQSSFTCSMYLDAYRQGPDSEQARDTSLMVIGLLRLRHDKAASESRVLPDPDSVDAKSLIGHARQYCEAHPTADLAEVLADLESYLNGQADSRSQHSNRDFEADADVRALVTSFMPPEDNDRYSGRDGYVTFRLGRDRGGKVGVVPDALMLAMNDTGAPVPDYGPNPNIIARVYVHAIVSDRPPSGTDDEFVKTEISAFIVGANNRDIWEIGRHDGVISIRLISRTQSGPWEAFEADLKNYHYYAQHVLEGRTAAMSFADPRLAELAGSACIGDRDAIARSLISGASPNGTGEDGMSPLIWAVDCGSVEGVGALLNAGADPNYVKTGTYFDDTNPPKRFIVARYSAIYKAVKKHNLPVLKLLLDHGGDPNANKDDEPFESALLDAWRAHDHTELDMLLDADKDISHPIPYDESLAAMAAKAGDFLTVEDMLKRGYKFELHELARLVQNYDRNAQHMRLKSLEDEQVAARERVVDLLKQSGIHFPILDNIFVMMTTSGLMINWGNVPSWHGFTPTAPRQIVRPDEPLYQAIVGAVGSPKLGDMKVIDPNDTTAPSTH